MARSNSPNASARRDVLRVLAAAKRSFNHLHRTWDVDGKVYEPHPDGSSRMGTWRARAATEYPENNAAYWRALAADLDDAVEGLTTLRDYALAEALRTTAATGGTR